MKTLYLECNMGAAGDMLMGALLELIPDREKFLKKLNQAGLPHVKVSANPAVKCGITGTHVSVHVDGAEEESEEVSLQGSGLESQEVHEHHHGHTHAHGHHHHAGMKDITEQIDRLQTDEAVKEDVKNIYRIIAQAESQVHGRDITEIHFHEVGTADALADITGCVMLIHELKPEQVLVSPVLGFGQVPLRSQRYFSSRPTLQILMGVPCNAGRMEGELCTPTGAAILTYFASAYGRMREMKMEKIGYGMGKRTFQTQTVSGQFWERLPLFDNLIQFWYDRKTIA